jgi:hypothetical protein
MHGYQAKIAWPAPGLWIPHPKAERGRRASHANAMPVILTTDEERDVDARALGRGEGLAATATG